MSQGAPVQISTAVIPPDPQPAEALLAAEHLQHVEYAGRGRAPGQRGAQRLCDDCPSFGPPLRHRRARPPPCLPTSIPAGRRRRGNRLVRWSRPARVRSLRLSHPSPAVAARTGNLRPRAIRPASWRAPSGPESRRKLARFMARRVCAADPPSARQIGQGVDERLEQLRRRSSRAYNGR